MYSYDHRRRTPNPASTGPHARSGCRTAHNRELSRIGDITGITPVSARAGREVALDQVPGPFRSRVRDCGGPPPVLAAPIHAPGAHQPGDPPLPAAGAFAAQGLVDAG
jgi:hypothetical protein